MTALLAVITSVMPALLVVITDTPFFHDLSPDIETSCREEEKRSNKSESWGIENFIDELHI